jgi:hypothetical protein
VRHIRESQSDDSNRGEESIFGREDNADNAAVNGEAGKDDGSLEIFRFLAVTTWEELNFRT